MQPQNGTCRSLIEALYSRKEPYIVPRLLSRIHNPLQQPADMPPALSPTCKPELDLPVSSTPQESAGTHPIAPPA